MNISVRELGKEYLDLLKPLDVRKEHLDLPAPDATYQALLDFALERRYLTDLSEVAEFPKPDSKRAAMTWVRIERLPVHPSQMEEYDLLSRWQSVLSTLHSWSHQLVFLLMRHQGKTHLYIGAVDPSGRTASKEAAAQLCQAATSQMPGIELQHVDKERVIDQIVLPFGSMEASGAVTGLPSLRKGPGYGLLQTLDQVAFGIRDFSQEEYDYAVVMIADPITDSQVANSMHVLRSLGSHIHTAVRRTVSITESEAEERESEIGWGFVLGTMLSFIPVPFLQAVGSLIKVSRSTSRSVSKGQTIGTERLDKTAQYCEELTDRHIERLKRGRNLGFWNTGVYVLAPLESTVVTILGMLRSVYSGEESYLEPIRVHLFHRSSRAAEWIQRFQHIPFPAAESHAQFTQDWTGRADGWHPLGSMYESITTPLNTEELSLATSLPRRDVPGLRFVRNAVRFATNPSVLDSSADTITLGSVMDTGVELNMNYEFDLNTLVRHALVTGTTGFGKSTTCRRLFLKVVNRNIPTLVIEPAKDEYVRWALAYNKKREPREHIQVFMPGATEVEGTPLQELRLNPFEPATAGDTVDFASRYERFAAVLSASLPMADVLPMLMEEAIYRYLQKAIETRFDDGEKPSRETYPPLNGLISTAASIIEGRGYEARVRENLTAAVKTRVEALNRGKRGRILNVEKSTSFKELFERPAVVNLSQITDNRDKALIMALLLTSLHEYRVSKYRTNDEYRRKANANQLCHLAIVEEAHRLLQNPEKDYLGVGNPQAVVSEMFSEMLAEFRAYGQGLLIVDQVPSNLIPNAIKNTTCKIVHRLPARDDRAAMSASMALRPDQEDIIASLPVGHAIICSERDDAASWVKIQKPE